MLEEICKAIIRRNGKDHEDLHTTADLLRLINSLEPEAARLITQWKNASDACDLLRNDYEMRHKIPDIWQVHLERCRHELAACGQALALYLRQQELGQLADEFLPDF
ncbi:MAG TPA: hypothetical protein PKE03_08105 [Bacteroidales bacterium]|mgnify:CR=1 FL=1|nr:hypothetical protein [Bacteroidales bacterium]